MVWTPLKNMKVSWDDSSQYMESHSKFMFQSAPTRSILGYPHDYGTLHMATFPIVFQRPAAARHGAAPCRRGGAELSRSAEHAEYGATGSSDLDIATATVLWLVKKM